MANFSNLKAAINAVIKQNGQGEITGEVMNQVLTAMVNSLGSNYQFAGVATPSTNPGTPDQNVFYMATQAGTYTNFSAIVLQAGISILLWNGSWSSETFFTIDAVPTAGSNNFVTSGGVQNELALGAVYDVSAKNPNSGVNNDGKWESLSALLSDANLSTLIPTSVRKGGMSIKFIQSSDHKYVQYRYMGTAVTGTPNTFLDEANWQGAYNEVEEGSINLIESGAVAKEIVKITGKSTNKTKTVSLGGTNPAIQSVFDGLDVKVGGVYKVKVSSSASSLGSLRVFSGNSWSSSSDKHSIAEKGIYYKFVANADINELSVWEVTTDLDAFDITIEVEYVTNGSILNIENELGRKATIKKICVSKNLFDPTMNLANGYIADGNGTITFDGLYHASDYIDITGVTHLSMSGKVNNVRSTLPFTYCLFYDASKNPIVDSYSVSSNHPTIPSNAKYLRTSIAEELWSEIQIENSPTMTSYEPYEYKVAIENSTYDGEIDNLKSSTYNLEDEVSDIQTDRKIETVGEQIQFESDDNTKSVSYRILQAYNGDVVSTEVSSKYRVSGFIEIEGGEKYCVSCNNNYGNGMLAFYDENEDYIPNSSIAANVGSTLTSMVLETVTAPANARYIRLACFSTIIADTCIAPIVIKTTDELIRKWAGKKWAAVGDSLTEVNYTTTIRYFDYVSRETGISVVNLGYGGTGYANNKNGKAFMNRMNEIPLDVDVITIFGSGNDNGAKDSEGNTLPLGDATDDTNESICGCINITIDRIQERCPITPLGIVSPTPWVTYEPNQPYMFMKNYSAKLKEICMLRGIPFLDLYYCSNLHPSSASFRALAYSKDLGNLDGNPAGVHPDETGHKIIAPRFLAFLDMLLL